jgi:hypothetical protein
LAEQQSTANFNQTNDNRSIKSPPRIENHADYNMESFESEFKDESYLEQDALARLNDIEYQTRGVFNPDEDRFTR